MTEFEYFIIFIKLIVYSIGVVNFTMLITFIVLFIADRYKKRRGSSL